jgi:hypothetical protein
MMTPLRLTDSQLHAVRKAAALLRPQARDAFLRLLAHELADLDPIDDALCIASLTWCLKLRR